MPYGTESFTDRYGDYKQPTVVDLDKVHNSGIYNDMTKEEKAKVSSNLKTDRENLLMYVLSVNPFFAKDRYSSLVLTNENNKLSWNIETIEKLSLDVGWLLALKIYLDKCKNNFYNNK